MQKTRNLFILTGLPEDVSCVIKNLQFKGMVTVPYGENVTNNLINKAFANNKSVLCSEDYYSEEVPNTSITKIRVVSSNTSLDSLCNESKTIIINDNCADQFAQIANNLGYDIGDHKSNSSGLNGTPTIKDCVYCKYLSGYIGENERTVYRSKNFFVMPTLGQFVCGYLLIIPFEHIMSNAELDSDVLKEFETVLEDIEYLLKLTYNNSNILVWENGTGNSGKGKAKDSIVHSHVHICPSSLNSDKIEILSGFPFETISISELSNYKEHSYLLIRSPEYSSWKINNNPELYIPRQYVRQLLAEEYNLPDDSWNWRKYYFKKNMTKTVEDIRTTLITNWNTLPERIKNNTSFLI